MNPTKTTRSTYYPRNLFPPRWPYSPAMPRVTRTQVLLTSLALLQTLVISACLATSEPVTLMRIPDGGRMPQASIDRDGTIHLMYYRGAMTGGDLFYVNRSRNTSEWSTPTRVNSTPHSAIGMGPMDGGDMVFDQSPTDGGRIHVAWFIDEPIRFVYTRNTENLSSLSLIHI